MTSEGFVMQATLGEVIVGISSAVTELETGFWPCVIDSDGDGIPDELDNCPYTYNPDQEDADGDGLGDVCDPCTDTDGDGFGNPGYPVNTCPVDNCPDDYNPQQKDNDLDGDGNVCDPDDDGDGVLDDGDGSGITGDMPCNRELAGCDEDCQCISEAPPCDDNCPFASNRCQLDSDGDGKGNACDPNCVVRVGPAPGGDFSSIAAALEWPDLEDDCTIRVTPGVYAGPLIVPRFVTIRSEGSSTDTVIDGGGTGTAVDIPPRADRPGHVVLEGFTIRNATVGLEAREPLTLSECTVEGIAQAGANLGILSPGSSHRIRDVVFRSGGAGGDALRVFGTAEVVNSLMTCSNYGVVVEAGGALSMSFTTVAGNEVGLHASAGSNLQIDHSIVCGNETEISGVACMVFAFSDICGASCSGLGGIDCTGQEGNIDEDPMFVDPQCPGDYHLVPGSPAVDAGMAPECYEGLPCTDLDGNPRLLDADGDLLAHPDMGSYEHAAASLVPDAIRNLQWDLLGYDYFGLCLGTNPDPSQTSYSDDEVPEPEGEGLFYLVTGENDTREGTKGMATCAERSNFVPCP
jgi:hypothetical protein